MRSDKAYPLIVLGDDTFYADLAQRVARNCSRGRSRLSRGSATFFGRMRGRGIDEHDLFERGVPKDKIVRGTTD